MPNRSILPLLAISAILPATLSAQTIATKTTGMKHLDGYLPLDWDAKAGKLYLEIPHLDANGRSPEFLYTHSLPYGTGSNDLGLDRGQISSGEILHFERTGPKVLLVEPNQSFRSTSTDPLEQLAVRQSFPESILYGFKVEAEDPSGAVLVDATEFYLRDAHDVAEILSSTKQGGYKLDSSRSTIALDATKAFPQNTEVESILTFTTDDTSKAEFVNNVLPIPCPHPPRTPVLHRTPRCRLHSSSLRPSCRLLPYQLPRLRRPTRRSARPAVHHPPPPHQKRSFLQTKL